MTAEEITLKKLEFDAETKRQQIRAGVWKIALGTAVVGVAAAFFPFAQQYATQYFAAKIEIMQQEAAVRIRKEELEVERLEAQKAVTTLNRDFLASIAEEGRSKNLEDRIILAEYYFYLANDGDERKRWGAFREHLVDLREKTRQATINAAIVAVSAGSSAEEIARATAEARVLEVSAAAGGSTQQAPTLTTDPGFEAAFEDLSAEDVAIRRTARTRLASLGLGVVRPAMIKLSDEGLTYRERLGLIVALTEMLRANKTQRQSVSELLQPDDLDRLVIAATDRDRTLRIHAAEFLYDLGDPRSFELAVELWSETVDSNGRYNLALVMKGAAPFLDSSSVGRARTTLKSLKGKGPKTDSLLDDAIRSLRR